LDQSGFRQRFGCEAGNLTLENPGENLEKGNPMRLPHFTLGVGLELASFADLGLGANFGRKSGHRCACAETPVSKWFQGQKALKDLNDAGVSIF